MTLLRHATLTLALSTLLAPRPAEAQIRASERGTVSQVIDGTTIRVDFARPQARGRTPVFGNVVHWGEMWTPGANWATTLEVDRDVRLDGHELPVGRYSMWMVPADGGDWTVHLHEEPERFHTQMPDPADAFLTWDVTPGEAEHMEVLTFGFPEIRRDGTTLEFRWGTTRIAMEVAVGASRPTVALEEKDVEPYLGMYSLTVESAEEDLPPLEVELELRDGRLLGVVNQRMFTMEFIPTGEPHRFWPAFMEDGRVVDVEEFPVTFEVADGRATGYTIPGPEEGSIWMRAVRVGGEG